VTFMLTGHRLIPLKDDECSGLDDQLAQAGLPKIGTSANAQAFKFIAPDNLVVAYAALEGSGGAVLLRSVVVAPEHRGKGVGEALVHAVVSEAAAQGVRELWLLTETAEPFFSRLGFERVDRAHAPENIAATSEFTTLCPVSAACMKKALG